MGGGTPGPLLDIGAVGGRGPEGALIRPPGCCPGYPCDDVGGGGICLGGGGPTPPLGGTGPVGGGGW